MRVRVVLCLSVMDRPVEITLLRLMRMLRVARIIARHGRRVHLSRTASAGVSRRVL